MLRAVLCVGLLAAVSDANAQPDVGPRAATTLWFDPDILANLGIEIVALDSTAEPTRAGGLGFAIELPAALEYRGAFVNNEGFSSGSLRHIGGFSLAFGDRRVSLDGFELVAAASPDEFALVDRAGVQWFRVSRMHFFTTPGGRELELRNADLLMTARFADALGRPELAGTYLAVVDTTLPADVARPVGPARAIGAGACVDDFNSPTDVALIQLSDLTQHAREAFGRVAIAPSAELRNVGNSSVEWGNTIEPDALAANIGPHPYLSLHFYRLAGGRLEQIGQSDVKHAFFATNSGIDCVCPGGQVLYPDCTDTYGSFLNGNRLHLAPRDRVSAKSGAWTLFGSHFDAFDVGLGAINPSLADNFRSHQAAEHDSFEHRLVVQEGDLQTPGARYFTEAWYVVARDTNIYNGMGHREVTPTLDFGTWSFAFDTNLVNGSMLEDAAVLPGALTTRIDVPTAQNPSQGQLQLAVHSSALGGGSYRYEYALMNFDFDRQVRSISIPIPSGVTVSNPGFRALVPGTWNATVGAGSVTWTAPTGSELDWGTLANFFFDADGGPGPTSAMLVPLEGGAPSSLTVATRGPQVGGGDTTFSFHFPGPGAAFVDTNPATSVFLSAGSKGSITDLNVAVQTDDFYSDEVDLFLSHAGVTVQIYESIWEAGDDGTATAQFNATFDDESNVDYPFFDSVIGTFRPFPDDLSAFDGMELSGNWELRILDEVFPGDTDLLSWSISGTAIPEPGGAALGCAALAAIAGFAARRRRSGP